MNHRVPPQEQLFPRSTAASNPRKTSLGAAAWISAACTVAIVMIVGVTLRIIDSPASGAADHAAVTVKPAAQGPGPAALPQRQTEYAPPIGEVIPGDGTWLVGKQIKRGTYRSAGGTFCYWARLRDLSHEQSGTIANGYGRGGPQVVAIGKADVAFISNGCEQWVMVK